LEIFVLQTYVIWGGALDCLSNLLYMRRGILFYLFLGQQVLLHDKVAALRKEREGQSRSPTPPPHIK
jgi:hypothetical protein